MTKKKDLTDTIAIYEEALSGKRKRFPKYTWHPLHGGHDNFKKCIRYLVLDKLQIDRDTFLKCLSIKWLQKWHLDKGREYTYSNLFSMVTNCFPEFDIQPWELNVTAWDDIHAVDVFRWLISTKLRWNREQIVMNFSGNTLREHNLYKIYYAYDDIRIFDILLKAYPEYHFGKEEFRWSTNMEKKPISDQEL